MNVHTGSDPLFTRLRFGCMSVLGIFSVQSSNATACLEVQKTHASMPLQLESSYCLSKTAFKFLILLWWVCVVLKGLTLYMWLSHEKGVCQWKVFALEVPVHYNCFLAHQFGHLMVAQNLIIFMIIIGLWTSNHFFSHNQSVTSSHGNIYQYIIFRKLFLPLDTVMLSLSRYLGYICYLSEILNIIYMYIHTQEENVLICYCYKLLFPCYAGLKVRLL